MKILLISVFLLLSGCAPATSSMLEIRQASPAARERSALPPTDFVACFIRFLEEQTGNRFLSTYLTRQFGDTIEVIAQQPLGGNAIGFVLSVSPLQDGSNIILKKGYREETDYAIRAIDACEVSAS